MTPPVARSRAAGTVAGLAVVGALAVVLVLARRVWFFGDDWAFLLGRSLRHDTVDALFAPHNEHWSTVPVLVFRALYAVVGLRHYLPYALPVLAAHAVVCLMVWSLSRRAGAAPWAATAAVVVVAFLGAGAEDLVWDFQIGFVGSIAAGLVAVWAADHGGRRWDVAAVVALVVAFASSGMGAVAWVLFTAVVLARRGWRTTLVLAGIPALVFLAWFLGFGRSGLDGDSTPRAAYLQLPEYLWRGLSGAWGDASGVPGAGPALVVVVVGGVLLLATRRPARVPADLRLLAAGGVGTAVFLYLFVGLTRVRFGVEQAEVSRYAYIAVVLGAFAVAAAVTALLPGPAAVDATGEAAPARPVRGPDAWTVAIVLVAVVGLVTVSGVRQLADFANARAQVLASTRPTVLAAVQLAGDGAPSLTERPSPTYDPDVTMTALRSAAVQDAFGEVVTTPAGRLDARAAVQTGVSPTDPGLPAPASLTWDGVSGPAPAATGCTSGDAATAATIDLTPGADGRAAYRLAGAGTAVEVRLLVDGVASTPVVRQLDPDGSWIATVAAGAVTRVVIQQPSRVTVCAGGS